MSAWAAERADAYLDGLRDVGWHLGLERMRELCARLGDPQRCFRVIHVVGTNGKSSVTEMCRGLLAEAGLRAGAYLSPHLGSWSERVRLPSGDERARFAASVEEVAAVASEIGIEGQPTQFELATAAAFVALARDDVEVAAIEAGLGGRLDATNVCEGEVVVLTTVALEHTRWLGDTVEAIAAEKLAVVGPGATLVLGNVSDEVRAQAEAVVSEAGGVLIDAFEGNPPPSEFMAENEAVARCAVKSLGAVPGLGPTGPKTPNSTAGGLPARAELTEGKPSVLLDLAHNPAAATALARSPELAGETVVACVALLDDKDLQGFAGALAPALAEVVATETGELPGSARPGARSQPATDVADAFRTAGVGRVEAVEDPRKAIDRTLARAGEAGGMALITGSHYLVRHAWTPGRDRS